MRRLRVKLAIGVAVLGVVVTAAVAVAGDRSRSDFRTSLTGYEEVPALSTAGVGSFSAAVSRSDQEIRYRLTFGDFESAATQAHIHFEKRRTTARSWSSLLEPRQQPAGAQACPTAGGTVSGTITPAHVGPGGAADASRRATSASSSSALRAGATYVNVHTAARPGGEIRGQLDGSPAATTADEPGRGGGRARRRGAGPAPPLSP